MGIKLHAIFVLLLVLAAGPVAWGQALIKPYFIKKSDQQMKLEAEQSKKFFSRIGDEVTPSQFDLLKYQTPVKNQGKRGTCVAFASAAQVETLVKIKSGNTVDLSEQYIYWASKVASKVAPNQEGSDPLSMLKSISVFGIVSEFAWPYESTPWYMDPTHPDCVMAAKTNENNVPTQCLTNGMATTKTLSAPKLYLGQAYNIPSAAEAIMGYLLKGVPVQVGMDVYAQAWSYGQASALNYQLGRVTMPQPEDKLIGGHAVLIVGYDKVNQVFLFKNSWGTDRWASKARFPGFGTVPFEYVRKYAGAVVASLQ